MISFNFFLSAFVGIRIAQASGALTGPWVPFDISRGKTWNPEFQIKCTLPTTISMQTQHHMKALSSRRYAVPEHFMSSTFQFSRILNYSFWHNDFSKTLFDDEETVEVSLWLFTLAEWFSLQENVFV